MPKNEYVKGETNVTLNIFIQDSSSSVGAGLTGLVYDSAGLTCSYTRLRAAAVEINLVTLTVTGAHADGGFKEIDAVLQPGMYRLDLPDAVCAAGVDAVTLMLEGASNMAQLPMELQLPARDPNTALNDVSTAEVNTQMDVALADYNGPTSAEMVAAFAALENVSLAQITTEISDALGVDTIPELGQAQPAKNPTIKTCLMLGYMALRNLRETTATRDQIYDDAGTQITKSVLSSDGVTVKREKFISGS
jgi:hypothetical protein